MKSIEVSARRVEDAISEGLRILGTTIDEVDVEIISQGGIFKKAKVKLNYGAADEDSVKEILKSEKKIEPRDVGASKSEPQKGSELKPTEKVVAVKPAGTVERAASVKRDSVQGNSSVQNSPVRQEKKERFSDKRDREKHPVMQATADEGIRFLKETLKRMNVNAELKTDLSDGLAVDIVTEDSAVIGYRGETLDALEYLTSLSINAGDEKFVKVRLNCNEYREKRIKILENLARKMADKCIKQQRKVILEPMSSAERRAIHAALSDNEAVFTKSEGSEPNRHIVILFKRDKKD